MSEISDRMQQVKFDASAVPKSMLDRLTRRGYAPSDIPVQLQHIVYEKKHPEHIPVIDMMVNTFIADLEDVLSAAGETVSPQVAQGLIVLSMNRRFLAST